MYDLHVLLQTIMHKWLKRTQPPNTLKEVTNQPKKLLPFNSYNLIGVSNMEE